MSFQEVLLAFPMAYIYGIVAIGIYLSFRVLDFPDLTCDGSFVLGAAVSSVMINLGLNPWWALIAALGAGGLAGMTTGLLSTRLAISPLLSGILVAFMLYSVNLKVMGGIPNLAFIDKITLFSGHVEAVWTLAGITIALVALLGYLLLTDFGLALRSIGQNPRLALNNGVRIGPLTVIGLMLSNACISLGGALFSQYQGFVDISQGIGTVILGLAAVMIGERVFPGRSPWVVLTSCVVGSLIYRVLVSLALHSDWLGLETQEVNLLTGLLVVGVMLLPRKRPC